MKNSFFLFIFIFLLSTCPMLAQQSKTQVPPVKSDVILKVNGDELSGKVLEMGDDAVKFSYAGETLVYTIKKSDILKITYASGRIETITNPSPSESKPDATTAAGTAAGSSSIDHHNRVAILPFGYIKDGQNTADVLSEQVQAQCYSYMSKHSGTYTILDPRTTNALLIKAGVTKDNIEGYTMDDLCNMLNVEYVVDGLVSVNKTTQSNYESNSGDVKTKTDKSSSDKTTYSGSSSSTSTQNYQTTLNINIYNDKGNSVYSQDRKSFWQTQDAYTATLEYLLKRTPLYSK